jgi:hypothetical protein
VWELPSTIRFGILVPLVDISNTKQLQTAAQTATQTATQTAAQTATQTERDFIKIWQMASWIKCVAIPQFIFNDSNKLDELDLIEFRS